MSILCFRTCAIVIIYCAVLFAQISLGFSARDSLPSFRTRYSRSLDLLYRKHPSLRHAALSDNMRSLLLSLNRKKRFPHHGRPNKNWRTMPSKHWTYAETTKKPPLISINDIESPISRQKSNCKHSLSNDELALNDYEGSPISLVRRAAEIRSTSGSSSPPTKTTVSGSKKMDSTVKKRQASEEAPTTCVTVTGSDGGPATTPGANDTTTPSTATSANNVVTPAPDATTNATTPAAETTPPTDAMPVKNTQAAPMAMATTAGALMADSGNSGTAMNPVKISQTLDEILEDVESLADHKVTANEDFPCHVNGSWISEAGGVRLEVQFKDDNGTLEVTMEEETGKTKKSNQQGFLSNATWVLTGRIPLPKKSMIIVNGVNEAENQVATFIGECKGYSRFIQIIWGHWILGKATDPTSEGIFSQRVFIDALERVKSKRAEKKVTAAAPVAGNTENHMRLIGGATENHMRLTGGTTENHMQLTGGATENHTIAMEAGTKNETADNMDECYKLLEDVSETSPKSIETEKTEPKATSSKDIEEVLDDSAKHNPLTEKTSVEAEIKDETTKTLTTDTTTVTTVITDTTTSAPITTIPESETPTSSSPIETPSTTGGVTSIATTTSLEELPTSTLPTETTSLKTDSDTSKNDVVTTSTTESSSITTTSTQAATITEELPSTTASTVFSETDVPTTTSTTESSLITTTSTEAVTITEELSSTTASTVFSQTDVPTTTSTTESSSITTTSTEAATITEELPSTTASTVFSQTDVPTTTSTTEFPLIVTTASTEAAKITELPASTASMGTSPAKIVTSLTNTTRGETGATNVLGSTTTEGECKGYSRFIQIIWGHWIVGKSSDSSSESIFSQRVFMDSLEKVKKRTRITTTKSTTNEATTMKITTKSKRSKATTKIKTLATLKPENTECLFADKRSAQTYSTKKLTATSVIPKLPANIVKKLNSIQQNLGDVLKVLGNYGCTKATKFKRFVTVPPQVPRHAVKVLPNHISERLESLDRRLSKYFSVHKLPLTTPSRRTGKILSTKAPT